MTAQVYRLPAPPSANQRRTVREHGREQLRQVGGRRHLRVVGDGNPERPRTRGECEEGPRPCPFVTCRYNLLLSVDRKISEAAPSINRVHPELLELLELAEGPVLQDGGFFSAEALERMPPTCALDIAGAGGASLEDVAIALNVTRERTRQLEAKALARIQRRAKVLEEFAPEPGARTRPKSINENSGALAMTRRPSEDADEARERDEEDASHAGPVWSLPFTERGDAVAVNRVWDAFVKDSRARGFMPLETAANKKRRETLAQSKGAEDVNQAELEQKALAVARELAAKSPGTRIRMVDIAAECGLGHLKSDNDKGRRIAAALAPVRGKLLDWGVGRQSGVLFLDKPREGAPAISPTRRRTTSPPPPSKSTGDELLATQTPTVTDLGAFLVARRDAVADELTRIEAAIKAYGSVST